MSARYLGGIVSKDPLTLNPAAGNAANGVFTLEQYMQAVKNATWPGFDPYFNQTVLSLHGNGTNGAQNNTFLDGSTNNFTITRNGNTTQGTFSPFSVGAGEWSNYFDGTGDWLQLANNAAFDLGTGDCTIEAWVYTNSLAATQAVFSVFPASGTISGYSLLIATSGFLVLDSYVSGTNQQVVASNNAITTNTWVHVAYTRSGGTNRLFINGNLCTTSTNNVTQNLNSGGNTPKVGYQGYAGFLYPFNGYMSNVRVVKGRAVYTSAFTPSTVPLGATSGGTNPPQGTETSLLTCQSNRFVDNSTNAFAITANGDVRVTPFSPFAPTAAYSPSVNGGGGYFDGTGDYLTIADNPALRFGTGNFTIQCWLYRNVNSQSHSVGGKGVHNSTGWAFLANNTNTLRFSYGTTTLDAGIVPSNSWTHVAVVREGLGTDQFKFYIDGVQVGQATVNYDFNQTEQLIIGANRNLASLLNGYMAGLKITVGTAETITLPTAPPTGGTLLLNFTNAGIFDNTGKNVLETVADAQIDTTTKKFGTGSMEFDGTGDYLIQPFSNPDLTLGSGDWTIECWLYVTALPTISNFANIFDQRPGSTSGVYPNIRVTNGGRIEFFVNSVVQIQSNASTINTGVWYFISISKASGSTKMFVDGTQVGSTYTDSNNYLNSRTVIGGSAFTLGAGELNGYIDDLRITKGVARYTANFTAQTSQWQDQ